MHMDICWAVINELKKDGNISKTNQLPDRQTEEIEYGQYVRDTNTTFAWMYCHNYREGQSWQSASRPWFDPMTSLVQSMNATHLSSPFGKVSW